MRTWMLLAAVLPLCAADDHSKSKSLNTMLGVECVHCHVDGEWTKEDKPQFASAKKMMAMAKKLNENHLAAFEPVTCWTCHRGQPTGRIKLDMTAPAWPDELKLTPEQEKLPAGEVYKGLKSFGRMPAPRLQRIMGMFTQSLGVKCDHCHVAGDYASEEKPAKETARKMLRMATSTTEFFGGGQTPVFCGTCHRGAPKPERAKP